MTMDKALMIKMVRNGSISRMKLCPKGHYNSPNAEVCWKCGKELK